ncbi:TetR/AcrR family transcriptional regulator [Mycoplasma sp. P36-A1]|uniref:TetR/AcrR family transcriptional regulator n=1 Tax=Mycoplasma sp. P36-A1 TaxID=3252900 RepID=UPI003C2DAF10
MDLEKLSRTKSKRKKNIIDKAYKMFLERGISSTSMNDIAEACNITRRTIYNYFESKTDLLYYLMTKITKEVDPDFHLLYNEDLSATENMRSLLQRNFESYYSHMTDFLFITQVRIYLSYRLKTPLSDVDSDDMHIAFINEIKMLIDLGEKTKEFKKQTIDSKETAKLIYRSLYGYLSNITIGIKVDKEKYKEECMFFENMIIEYLTGQ